VWDGWCGFAHLAHGALLVAGIGLGLLTVLLIAFD
jgi:hypothetical protein